MRKCLSALLTLAFMVTCGAFPVSEGHEQEAGSSQQLQLGIIVTRTSEERQAVMKALKAGMDFGVLAKEKSIDSTADDGGDMGQMNPGGLKPELRDALLNMRGEKFTGIVPVPSGFAILTILAAAPKGQELDATQMQRMANADTAPQGVGIDGLTESDAAFGQYPKPAGWEQDPRLICTLRGEAQASAEERLQQYVTDAEGRTENKRVPSNVMHTHQALAQLHAYTGDMETSIKEWLKAYQIAQSDVPDGVPFIEQALGVSYLHLAWMENGAFRNSGDIDIFPPADPKEHYQKQDNSRMAIHYFQVYLDHTPEDLQVRWLLNLAYQTVGEYPAGVPAKFLVPPSQFASKQDIGRFIDVAPAAGLNVFGEAGGVLVEDYENNGLLDVITSS